MRRRRPRSLRARRRRLRASVRRRWAGRLMASAVLAGGLAWGIGALERLPIFRVQKVDISGIAHLTRPAVLELSGIDSSTSVWTKKAVMLDPIVAHPVVRRATLRRRPPSTLHLVIEEVAPVGLVATPLVWAVDEQGIVLPIDPTDPVLDLPVLSVTSSPMRALWGGRLLAREMDALRRGAPEVFAVVSEARLGDREVVLVMGDAGLRVRYAPPVSARRMREAMLAIDDAAQRFPAQGASEVDLRYADQVIVRTGAPPAQAGEGGEP